MVAYDYTFQNPYSPMDQTLGILSMAAGPKGDVVVGTQASSDSQGATALSAVIAPSGAGNYGPSTSYGSGGVNDESIRLLFDPEDHLLYSYYDQAGLGGGYYLTGYVGLHVNQSFSWMGAQQGANVSGGPIGADAAGNLFVQVSVQSQPWDFGLGPIMGKATLHYNPAGALVSDTLPTGMAAVGALGELYYATQVTGTVDEGCGSVGTAGVTSTVLTQRDQTGACLWSRALPTSTVFALDPSENVVLATTFSGTIDFGGGPLTSVGTSDLAIAKLDPSGVHVWSHRFGASGASVTNVSSLAAVSAGGLVLSATLGGAVDFGCGPVSSAAGGTLIANFDATGAVVYSRVVQVLATQFGSAGPVADGLGGVSFAVQVGYVPNCPCTVFSDCPNFDCFGGMCASCASEKFQPGNILVSRFAP